MNKFERHDVVSRNSTPGLFVVYSLQRGTEFNSNYVYGLVDRASYEASKQNNLDTYPDDAKYATEVAEEDLVLVFRP